MEHARDQQRNDEERHVAWPGARSEGDRRLTDRRRLYAVAREAQSAEDRRRQDRRTRDRRVKIAGAGLLAGLAFAVGARDIASLAGRSGPMAPIAADSAPSPDSPGGLDATTAPAGGEAGSRTWDRASLEPLIQEAATLHGLPADLIRAVIQTESHFNPLAVSRVGAKGLMQLMPRTAKHVGIEDPFDPRENILGGTKYLSTLLERFNGNTARALAAYNAGPTAVARHRGLPPFRETRNYVQKIHNLVEDTDAEFALPPAPKVRRTTLRSRAQARHAQVRRASSRSHKVQARKAKSSTRRVAARKSTKHRTVKRAASRRSSRSRR